ncbi:MAG: hypothetical protein IKQ85_00445 [Bacteroidaceae bacterium]|nr:hypothetical protein [Bacteroidaceae bacterium]
MKYNWLEKLLLVVAWVVLLGGIVFGTLVSKGILESNQEMCFPQALVVFVGSIIVSVAGWAILRMLVNISNKVTQISEVMKRS